MTDAASPLSDFQRLLSTAQIDFDPSQVPDKKPAATDMLTNLLRQAVDRWGFGLHHMDHHASITADGAVQLYADRTLVGVVTSDAEPLARMYTSLAAPNAEGLSDWPVLGDGHRTTLKTAGQLRVLVEDARDFETTWGSDRGFHTRVWRRTTPAGEVLSTEYMCPVDARELLNSAAWEAMVKIRDRSLQRELMKRSEQGGILQAFLGARHSGAAAGLNSHAEAHFAVQAEVVHLTGPAARDFDALKAAQRQAAETLKAMQERAITGIAQLLSGPLK